MEPGREIALTLHGASIEVESDLLDVVQEIRARWPYLAVRYLDPDAHREITDYPYIIVNQMGRVVLGVWKLDRSVIERLQMMESAAREVREQVDKELRRRQRELDQKWQDARAERRDIMMHIFRSPKGSYTFKNDRDELVKVTDD